MITLRHIIVGLMCLALSQNTYAQTMPKVVDEALSWAEFETDCAMSFSLRFKWKLLEAVTWRYEVADKTWRELEGDSFSLPKAARKKLKTWKSNESKPCGLIYYDFREHMKNVHMTKTEGYNTHYSFNMAKAPKRSHASVDTNITIYAPDGAIPILTQYRITAIEAFKPSSFVKLELFNFDNRFEAVFPDYPPLLTNVVWKAKGSRGLRSVNEDFKIEFCDFEKL